MKPGRRPISLCRRSSRHGLSLVEMLLALSISAGLLLATAAAVNASFAAYRINQEQSDLTQRARLTLHRMLAEIRQADLHLPAPDDASVFSSGIEVNTPMIRVGRSDSGTGSQFWQEEGTILRQAITWTRSGHTWTTATTGEPQVLLRGVGTGEADLLGFTLTPMKSPTAARGGLPYDLLRRGTVRFTLRDTARDLGAAESTGKQSVTLSSSVTPRRNAW